MENKYFQDKGNAVCVEFYYLCAFLFSSFFLFWSYHEAFVGGDMLTSLP